MAVAKLAEMTRVKQEPVDVLAPGAGPSHPAVPSGEVNPVSLEERILLLCAANPKGVTNADIVQNVPFIDAEKRLKALQRLLSQGKIDLLKQGSTLVYRQKTSGAVVTSKTKGFEREERLVYQIIEDSGNKGIWIRDIRTKSNLLQTQVIKILRTLESKKLIKSVNSVQAAKRKVFMIYDLVPDESITGGAWYSDQDFESEFVEVLNQHCLKFLQQKAFKAQASHSDPISRRSASYTSPQDVCKFITDLGISKVPLTVANIQTILDTLLYDGKAEMTVVAGQASDKEAERTQKLYRASRPLLQSTGFSRIPCGVCPLIDQCCDGGAISPTSCVYMKQWLDF